MALETKDYISLALSAAAFAVSIYNLLRTRLDTISMSRRTFEQKRFEAAQTAAGMMDCYARVEGLLETLRFEALRAGNSLVLEAADKHAASAKAGRSRYAAIFREYVQLPGPSANADDLLALEKSLGMLKAQSASVSEYETLVLNFVEDGRRLILAQSSGSPTPPPTEARTSNDA